MSGWHDATMTESGEFGGREPLSTGWVKILNESWPEPELARRLKDVGVDKQIPVTVRIVFETGIEHLPGIATRWSNGQRKHVRVTVDDHRVATFGVWVDPADVERL